MTSPSSAADLTSAADDVATCAAGEAAWHAAAYAGLAVPWHQDGRLGWGGGFAHRFLLGAVTLEALAVLPTDLPIFGPVRDSFGTLDLAPQWRRAPADPWMLRAPAPVDDIAVPGVRVVRTDDTVTFERVAFLGAGGVPPERPGELHPPGCERVPGVHLLLAVLDDGSPVGSTLAVVSDTGVHVTGVAVLATERRRGVGRALAATAIRCAPDRPATLAASAMAVRTYERLGFRTVPGRPLQWSGI